MMTVLITCPECGSAVHITPNVESTHAKCEVCQHETPVNFTREHEEGQVKVCPCCERKDFYSQKDFNRKIGVGLFILAAIASIWTYGISFIVLYLFDLILFKRLPFIVICYKCQTIFRNASNWKQIAGFNHEMNDRIIYADHDFQGRQLEH